MSLGEKLCNARLALKQTTSEVAAGTRMKVQTVEQLEREEFDKIPAPIYAKGFIKLYAEHVGLEPQPLIDEYMERFSGGDKGSLDPHGQPRVHKLLKGGKAPDGDAAEGEEETDLFDHSRSSAGSYPDEASTRPSLSDVWSHVADAIARSLRKLARDKGAPRNRQTAETGSGATTTVSGLTWRTVAIVAGVLIVLAFVVSGITQCGRRAGAEQPVAATSGRPQELTLAIEPPDPYID